MSDRTYDPLRDLKRLGKIKLVCVNCGHTRHVERGYPRKLWDKIERSEKLPVTWALECGVCGKNGAHFIDWPDT